MGHSICKDTHVSSHRSLTLHELELSLPLKHSGNKLGSTLPAYFDCVVVSTGRERWEHAFCLCHKFVQSITPYLELLIGFPLLCRHVPRRIQHLSMNKEVKNGVRTTQTRSSAIPIPAALESSHTFEPMRSILQNHSDASASLYYGRHMIAAAGGTITPVHCNKKEKACHSGRSTTACSLTNVKWWTRCSRVPG